MYDLFVLEVGVEFGNEESVVDILNISAGFRFYSSSCSIGDSAVTFSFV